jgi:hypothetical protein
MGDDGVNVSGDLDSIGSLSSGDLGEDTSFISGGELGRMATKRKLSTRLNLLKESGDSGPSNTKFGGNKTSGGPIRSKGEDVFLLSRGDGKHVRLGGLCECWPLLNTLNHLRYNHPDNHL